jgi:hypothetical protein
LESEHDRTCEKREERANEKRAATQFWKETVTHTDSSLYIPLKRKKKSTSFKHQRLLFKCTEKKKKPFTLSAKRSEKGGSATAFSFIACFLCLLPLCCWCHVFCFGVFILVKVKKKEKRVSCSRTLVRSGSGSTAITVAQRALTQV